MLHLDYYGGDYNCYNDYLTKEGNKKVKQIGYDLDIVNGEKVAWICELIPCNGQKSFNGRAKVITTDGCNRYLLSYDTIVCAFTQYGEFIKLWDGYSATTMKHINSFLTFVGWDCANKSMWTKLSCGQKYMYEDLYQW